MIERINVECFKYVFNNMRNAPRFRECPYLSFNLSLLSKGNDHLRRHVRGRGRAYHDFYYIVKVKLNLQFLPESELNQLDYSTTRNLAELCRNVQHVHMKTPEAALNNSQFRNFLKEFSYKMKGDLVGSAYTWIIVVPGKYFFATGPFPTTRLSNFPLSGYGLIQVTVMGLIE